MKSEDIAKIAGVSRSTVSRVINNYPNVPEKTRKKIQGIIQHYNYVPHASARMLAGKKNRIIGLFLIDTNKNSYEHRASDGAYFKPFISYIVDHANALGNHVLISILKKNSDIQRIKELFYNKTINGGIFIGSINQIINDIQCLSADGFVIGVVDNNTITTVKTPYKIFSVNADNYNGAYRTVQYLLDLGHKKIAHISGDMNELSASERLKGYKQALSDRGIIIDPVLVETGSFFELSGYASAQKLIRQKPTAIFAANDSMAIGAIHALNDAGLVVPDDISVVGFDDIEMALCIKPSLTTVRISLNRMAEILTINLINALEDNIDFNRDFIVPVELIIRESCKKQG